MSQSQRDGNDRSSTSAAAGARSGEEAGVAAEVEARLRGAGVTLSGKESSEELVRLLDAVEAFEHRVEKRGGDLMVDEPVGSGRPTQPDNQAFVLPVRGAQESVAAYIARISEASGRI